MLDVLGQVIFLPSQMGINTFNRYRRAGGILVYERSSFDRWTGKFVSALYRTDFGPIFFVS